MFPSTKCPSSEIFESFVSFVIPLNYYVSFQLINLISSYANTHIPFHVNTQVVVTQYGLTYGWSTFNQKYTISGILNQGDLVAYLNTNIPTIGTLIGDQYTFNDITSDTDNQLRNSLNTYINNNDTPLTLYGLVLSKQDSKYIVSGSIDVCRIDDFIRRFDDINL